MNSECLQPDAPLYPAALKTGASPAVSLQTIGNPQLLTTTKTAVLCSRQCPGEVILRLFDLARRLRASDLTFEIIMTLPLPGQCHRQPSSPYCVTTGP